jgi:predicted GNAT family acetyltransferase
MQIAGLARILAGQGIDSMLVRAALASARDCHVLVMAHGPFVQANLPRHPDNAVLAELAYHRPAD